MKPIADSPIDKRLHLERIIEGYGTILIAFSGGVDSTFLLAVAKKILDHGVVAVTCVSPFHPDREVRAARELARLLAVPHRILYKDDIEPDSLVANTKDRCYLCKKDLAAQLIPIAAELGIETIAHGANLDDQDDYRPGYQAAVEMGMVAPLLEARLRKNDIRSLSKQMNLPTWNKPAMACLATRIPYGSPLTKSALQMVDQAETMLLDCGFSNCRVRHHDNMARIEVPSNELALMLTEKIRRAVVDRFREIGYLHVALDLEGYTMGRMNRELGILV